MRLNQSLPISSISREWWYCPIISSTRTHWGMLPIFLIDSYDWLHQIDDSIRSIPSEWWFSIQSIRVVQINWCQLIPFDGISNPIVSSNQRSYSSDTIDDSKSMGFRLMISIDQYFNPIRLMISNWFHPVRSNDFIQSILWFFQPIQWHPIQSISSNSVDSNWFDRLIWLVPSDWFNPNQR